MSAPLEHQDALKTQPPRIPKPKQTGHNLTNKILQEAFEVDYYIDKTENWGHITMPASIRILKVRISRRMMSMASSISSVNLTLFVEMLQ
ncbi:hypothetical protein AOL_s00054g554 [Orbilia oligospora ATCC 24927]|uniref:Uncharacterized protein n=1 Tax=Arthrobotrys oligospora (strain ATCC 24927 / CBS 115.81 / DSM 1491) TaxID=756982 RepID=G1X6R0_ARTOA|nr:hypothetical protein AOL_s00054g554 [Orbilia oligospora ATCC 24927]EGX51178.1 hypothetical protein AOL_s00054g554 [Orbilia oligospora ATCC 24927]